MNKDLVRAMSPLGGGVAASGGPCGALTGGVAFIGSIMGKETPEQRDGPKMWKASYTFYKRFETEAVAEWGSVNCRDITGIDWTNWRQARQFRKDTLDTKCVRIAGAAARILGEVLEKYANE